MKDTEKLGVDKVIDECANLLTALEHFCVLLDQERDLDIRNLVRNRIKLAEVERDFGFKAGERYTDYMEVTDFSAISVWNDRKSIAWPDDDRQPCIGERLYVVSFPCGAYTLHPDYPKRAFGEFFDKLKAYGPKYSDTNNNCLYFAPSEAKAVHEDLLALIKEAREIGLREARKEKAERLKKELAELEADQ